MAQPGPEVAVASVCLIAVLYNYEQWRDRARDGESRDREREREKGRGRKRETWRREQKPAECHVKCIPRGDRRRGRGWREREATDREEGRGERERERDGEQERMSTTRAVWLMVASHRTPCPPAVRRT